MNVRLQAALGAALLVSLGIGCRVPEPQGPCLSDRECHADRICHEGRCRFVEEVRSALAALDDASFVFPDAGVTSTEPVPAPRAPSSGWGGTAMFMGDPRHTGRLPFDGPRGPVSALWTYHTGSRIYASPVIAPSGDTIVGSLDQSLTAVSPEGKLRFRYSGAGKFYASAAISRNGDIIAGSVDGTLVALTAHGQVRWQHKLRDAIDTSPVVTDDGRAYVAADGLYAFDFEGKQLFHYPAGAHVRSAPAVARDGTAIVGSYDRMLYAIASDGSLKWRFETAGRIRASARIDPAGRIYFGSQDDFVYGLSESGQLLFRHNLGRDVDSSPVIDSRGTLLIGADDGSLYALH